MQKNAFALKTAQSHNLELFGYLKSKNFREKYKLYKFETQQIKKLKT